MSDRNTLRDKITSTKDGLLMYQRDRTILAVTELICELMIKQDITRVGLAQKLGKSKGYVSQILDGSANMTISTVSNILTELGYQLDPKVVLLANNNHDNEKCVRTVIPIQPRNNKLWDSVEQRCASTHHTDSTKFSPAKLVG